MVAHRRLTADAGALETGPSGLTFVSIRDEDLRVGDSVRLVGGVRRITAIRPYRGPLTDIVFALADCDAGPGFSLCSGSYTEALR